MTVNKRIESGQRDIKPAFKCIHTLCIELLQIYSPSLCLIQQFAGNPDEHAVGKGRLETRLGELVEHFGHSEAIILPEVIQQAEGMVLENRAQITSNFN